MLHGYLTDADLGVRREVLYGLVHYRDPMSIDSATQLLDEDGPVGDFMRDLSIRCAQELDKRECIPQIRKYLRDLNEVTRIAAIVALSQWGDEPSRYAFEEAAISKLPRVKHAAQAALQRMGTAKVGSSDTVEGLIPGLESPIADFRKKTARELLKQGKAAKAAVPSLIARLKKLDGKTTTDEIGCYMEVLRMLGPDAKEAAEAVGQLLPDRSPIYNNRMKEELQMLRTSMMLVLADMGEAKNATVTIADYLANSDRNLAVPYAAAAYAAGSMGPSAKEFVPLLVRALTADYFGNTIMFPSFQDPPVTTKNTSARLEAIRALARIGSDAEGALPSLTQALAKYEKIRPDLAAECRKAIQRVNAQKN